LSRKLLGRERVRAVCIFKIFCLALLALVAAVSGFAETDILTGYGNLPIVHLIVLAGIAVCAIAAFVNLFVSGLSFRWGDKEITVGGIYRLLAKKDADLARKEDLKRFSDEVDAGTVSELYRLIDNMDKRLEKITVREHCFFSTEGFVRLIQEELNRRIRRNNLKERLAEESREAYVEHILRDVEERYVPFQYKTANVECKDVYAAFDVIREAVKTELITFTETAVALLVSGMKRKIEKYENAKRDFQTAQAREHCCDRCITKNRAYIKRLTGEEA
jgi:hypothetical protein